MVEHCLKKKKKKWLTSGKTFFLASNEKAYALIHESTSVEKNHFEIPFKRCKIFFRNEPPLAIQRISLQSI